MLRPRCLLVQLTFVLPYSSIFQILVVRCFLLFLTSVDPKFRAAKVAILFQLEVIFSEFLHLHRFGLHLRGTSGLFDRKFPKELGCLATQAKNSLSITFCRYDL